MQDSNSISSLTLQNSRPRVALLASPGFGHLIPVLELGKRLIFDHNFHVTVLFVVSIDASTSNSLLKSSSPNLTIVTLPFVDISSLVDPTDHIVTIIAISMRESLLNLRNAISDMKFKPTALIVDLFGTEAFAIADDFSMLKYLFVTTNTWFLAVTIYVPIAKSAMEEHVHHKKPLQLPGCRHVRYEDAFDGYLDMDTCVYNEYVRIGTGIPMADGILINTWEDFDLTTIQSLRDPKHLGHVTRVPLYPIGPLYRPIEPVVGKAKDVMEWLDNQPIKSVVYVSFGSGGTLSAKQTKELTAGLQLSQQRFIWVFHPPIDGDVSRTFFSKCDEPEALKIYLPDEFLTHIQDKGHIIPMWAPQTAILAHPSLGGFLTHCGWNSTIESIMHGVPMIAWPLYAEQKMNATQLEEDHKVALRLKKPSMDSVIGRDEIAEAVRKIIEREEGESMRQQVEQLRDSAQKAISEAGTSKSALSQVVKELEYRHHCLVAMPTAG